MTSKFYFFSVLDNGIQCQYRFFIWLRFYQHHTIMTNFWNAFYFEYDTLVNVIFDNTDLSHSNFEEAVLENVDFKESYQHGSNIIKSKSIQSCLGIQEQLQNKDFNKWELD